MKILSDFVRTAPHAEHKQADHFAKSQRATRNDDPVVDQAVQTFRMEFSQDVDQDDLENITRLWESLTPDQAQAAFSELTPEEVEGWGNEARRSTGWSDNGLTGGQQQDLFNTLASRLNGEQLAQVAVAFHNSDRMQEAVATYAPADTKAEFLVATVPDADDPADAALSIIRKEFSEDVDQDDLELVNQVWANLTPEQAQEVFSQLAPEEIQFWGSEAQRSTTSTDNGLTGGQQQSLFDTLAGRLTGEQLAQVADAFGNVDRVTSAVLEHGSAETRADYALAIAADASGRANRPDSSIWSGKITTTYGNDEANAVADLLVSLQNDPEQFNRVIAGLSDAQLTEVMGAARGQVDTVYGEGDSSVNSSFDTSRMTTIIDAAARNCSVEQRARVFEAGSVALDRISGNAPNRDVPDGSSEATGEVLDSLNALLQTDPTGIVAELEENYRDGGGITSFMREMVAQDRNEDIAGLVVSVQSGNGQDENPVERFLESDGQGNYRNAQSLGYVVGALQSGVTELNRSNAEKAGDLEEIFGLIAVAGEGGSAPVGVVTSGLEWVTSQLVDDTTSQLAQGNIDFAEAIRDLAYPRDASGDPVEFEAAETAYDSALGRVIDAQTQE
jgi:hypothetical protein